MKLNLSIKIEKYNNKKERVGDMSASIVFSTYLKKVKNDLYEIIIAIEK